MAGKWQLLGNAHQQKLAGNRMGTTPGKAGFDDFYLWQINQLGSRYKDPVLSPKREGVQTYQGQYGPDIFLGKINSFMEVNLESPFLFTIPWPWSTILLYLPPPTRVSMILMPNPKPMAQVVLARWWSIWI